MKRPSFQFYPADWQVNSNLRRCTHAEKGIWMDVLCLMHDSEEYGILRWSLKEIANAIGCTVSALRGIVDKSVMKGVDAGSTPCEPFVYVPRSGRKDGTPVTLIPTQPGPLWYSSRMVKDEYVKANSGAQTRFGNGQNERKNEAPATAPSRREGANKSDGSSSSSSSSDSAYAESLSLSYESSPVDEPMIAFEAYNDLAREIGLPVAEQIKTRRTKIAKRLKENGGIEGWRKILNALRYSPFCRGENDKGWKGSLDFLLQPSSLARLLEGNYGNDEPAKPSPSPAPPKLADPPGWAQWRARLSASVSQGGMWIADTWGPPPGDPRCECPGELLAGYPGIGKPAQIALKPADEMPDLLPFLDRREIV